jgi:hypothetical protein
MDRRVAAPAGPAPWPRRLAGRRCHGQMIGRMPQSRPVGVGSGVGCSVGVGSGVGRGVGAGVGWGVDRGVGSGGGVAVGTGVGGRVAGGGLDVAIGAGVAPGAGVPEPGSGVPEPGCAAPGVLAPASEEAPASVGPDSPGAVVPPAVPSDGPTIGGDALPTSAGAGSLAEPLATGGGLDPAMTTCRPGRGFGAGGAGFGRTARRAKATSRPGRTAISAPSRRGSFTHTSSLLHSRGTADRMNRRQARPVGPVRVRHASASRTVAPSATGGSRRGLRNRGNARRRGRPTAVGRETQQR